MKASMFLKSTVILTGLLASLSACSGKKEAGSGGNTPATPVNPTTVSGLGDSFDNMRGMNPLMSIQGQAIRNANFALVDASGAQPGYYVNVTLSFDANGLLSANAVIDSATFESNQMNRPMDPWSNYNNQPRTNTGLITYRAVNVPYNFNQRTGAITIRNFVAGSSVRTQSVTSTTMNFPQQTSYSGRKAILIGDVKISKKALLNGHLTLRGSTSSGKMSGYLANLSDFSTEDDSRKSSFHPMTHGFELGCAVKLSPGELVSVPNFVYTNVNGNTQQTQSSREEWLPSFTPVALIYSEPVLDPRLRK